MNKYMEKYVDFYKIDSTSITFNVNDLEYYDKSIHDVWQLVNVNTGEPDPDFSRSDYMRIDHNGARFDIKYYELPQKERGRPKRRYINIIVYARHLGKDYFQGINDDNLVALYSYVMDVGVIKCSFDTFINSPMRKMDIAIDSFAHIEQVDQISKELQKLHDISIPFKEFKYCDLIASYQYGRRQIGKKCGYSYSEPFFKLYNKYLDGKSGDREHVSEFYDYIGFDVRLLENYYRFEMSIKDADQLNKYLKKYSNYEPVKHLTLNFVCQLMKDDELMRKIRIDMLQQYLRKAILIEEESEEKTQVMDIVLKNLVNDVVDHSEMNINETVIYIMETFFNGVNARTKRRYKVRITSLVKIRMIEEMRDLNKDGLEGLLKGKTELHEMPIKFESVLANLVL